MLQPGLSEASAAAVRQAHGVQPVTAIETEYSLRERELERNCLLQACEALGIGFVRWSPVGMGYVIGTPQDSIEAMALHGQHRN